MAMQINWQRLRRTLFFLGLTLGISAILVWHSYYFLLQKQKNKQRILEALEQIENLQEQSQIALEILQQSYRQFNLLQAQGVMEIEQEQRLYWLNRLHQLKSRHQLTKLSYRFSQRKSYALPHLILDQRFKLYVTDMELDFSLKHSQNLLDFLNALAIKKPSLLKLKSCTLQRQHSIEQALQQQNNAHLQVHCQLQWFTTEIKTQAKNN